MKRFLIIENDILVAERYAKEIVNGEIEADEIHSNLKIGMNIKTNDYPPKTNEQLYQESRNQFLYEIKIIKENIDLGDAVQDDLIAKQNEWKALKTEKGW